MRFPPNSRVWLCLRSVNGVALRQTVLLPPAIAYRERQRHAVRLGLVLVAPSKVRRLAASHSRYAMADRPRCARFAQAWAWDRNLNLTQRFYGLVATVVASDGRRIAFENAAYDQDYGSLAGVRGRRWPAAARVVIAVEILRQDRSTVVWLQAFLQLFALGPATGDDRVDRVVDD